MTTLEKLQKENSRTWAAFQDYKKRVDDEVREAVDAVRAKHKDHLDSLGAIHDGAEAAFLAEQNRVALANATSPWPVGTGVAEWTMWGSGRFGRRLDDWTLTGRVGIIEIWKPDSVRPDTMSQHSLPTVGCCIIRLLKADGTTSKKFVVLGDGMGNWRPEGQKPKGAK